MYGDYSRGAIGNNTPGKETPGKSSPVEGQKPKPEPEYAGFCKIRQYLRARVTRIHNQIIEPSVVSIPERKLKEFRSQLTSLSSELNDINIQINSVMPDGVSVDEVWAQEDVYRENISVCLGLLAEWIEEAPPNPPSNSHAQNIVTIPPRNSNQLKLPPIELPIFSNDSGDNLEKFFYAFEAITDKNNLSSYEKFVYLRNQVRKGPEALLNSLETNNQTYAHAKKLLQDAFASPLTQKYEVIKRLSELRLGVNDDVYSFIGSMRSILASMDNLKIDMDTVIQYFIWKSFSRDFQDQLIQITNATKPDLTQINENLFSAAERYTKLSERKREQNRRSYHEVRANLINDDIPITNNIAVNIKSKSFRACNLCTADKVKNVEHDLRNCTVYATASDKVKKLRQLKYCTKCSFTNHDTASCKFKFHSPCRDCGKPHMTFLCLKPVELRTSVNVTCVTFNTVVRDESEILPSITLNIGKDFDQCEKRVLYDTGTQRNFITELAASEGNLDTIQEGLDLRINGFNVIKIIKTRVVNVPMVIGKRNVVVSAIVVPEITILFKIKNFSKITKEFKKRGYVLADKALGDSDVVSEFDLVMGSDLTRFLCPQPQPFGPVTDPAVFFKSEMGILLSGEAVHLMENLKHLPFHGACKEHDACIDVRCRDISSEYSHIDGVMVNASTINEMLNDCGEISNAKLQKATEEALDAYSNAYFDYDFSRDCLNSVENQEIIDYVLDNTDRTVEGRLIMPLPWKPDCKELLSHNYNISRKILLSTLLA